MPPEKLLATVEREGAELVPKAIIAYLGKRNLAASIRVGADDRLAIMRGTSSARLQVKRGPSDGDDEVGLSACRPRLPRPARWS